MMQTVRVELGKRSYDIHIGDGLLQQAGTMIAALRPGARVAIVTDENVGAAHAAALERSLDEAGIARETITVAPGEASKSMETFAEVVNRLLAARLERNDLVIAFGGGVIGDLAGFAAAVTRRGMDFVQIPTSLLAQVDSSVGGKTGINAEQGKNLIGAFHQPVLVIADTALLRSLPPREFRAGYAEVVKYGLIDRPDFFRWLEENRAEIFAFGPALQQAVATACRAKAEVVAADETETGARALLNLGHTFGHALEAATKYDSTRLVHGEGVAIGMMLAHEFSNRLNLCDADTVATVHRHLSAAGLPTAMSQIPGGLPAAQTLLEYITQDKKVKRGRLTFILTKGLGQSYIADDVPPSEVLAFLTGKLEP
jgi:3-dehydroquinate synthase